MSKQPVDVPPWLGWLFVVVGSVIAAAAVGLIPLDPDRLNAPRWILGLVGFMFSVGGFRLLTINRPHLSRWAGPLLTACFGIVGLWVGLFGKADAFGGGSSLVSAESNVSIARWLFGGMGGLLLISLPFMLYHWRSLR